MLSLSLTILWTLWLSIVPRNFVTVRRAQKTRNLPARLDNRLQGHFQARDVWFIWSRFFEYVRFLAIQLCVSTHFLYQLWLHSIINSHLFSKILLGGRKSIFDTPLHPLHTSSIDPIAITAARRMRMNASASARTDHNHAPLLVRLCYRIVSISIYPSHWLFLSPRGEGIRLSSS